MKKRITLCYGCAILLGVAGGTALNSCTDSDYDLSKDIDLTMGLGSQGLALRLGNTQNIYLRDFFTVDDSEMLDTLGSGLYYLIQDGEASATFDVNSIRQTDPVIDEELKAEISSLAGGTTVPAGDVAVSGVTGQTKVRVNIKDIPEEILSIRRISSSGPVEMSLELEVVTNSPGFSLKEITSMSLDFPSYIYSSQYEPDTHTYVVVPGEGTASSPNRIPSLRVDSLVLGGSDAPFGLEVEDGSIEMPDDATEYITMTGTFVLANGQTTTLDDEGVSLNLKISLGAIRTGEITGQVSPEIEPEADPVDISSDLPDFLQGEGVRLEMTNPTIRFDVYGQSMPVPLLLWGELDSRNYTASGSESILSELVRLPSEGKASIPDRTNSSFYFFQGDAPFDVDYNADAKQYEVDNLSTLVETLPDFIEIDLGGGKVASDLTLLHTLSFPTYETMDVDYRVLIPFRFSGGTQIMYTDSVVDMNGDLEDYSADSLFLTGVVENHVPLDLVLELVPQGVPGPNGERPSLTHLITVNPVEIAAAQGSDPADNVVETPFRIALKMSDPQAVKLLDALEFQIHASSSASGSQELSSKQYLKLNDLRLRLGGQIVGDFNDDKD